MAEENGNKPDKEPGGQDKPLDQPKPITFPEPIVIPKPIVVQKPIVVPKPSGAWDDYQTEEAPPPERKKIDE